MARRRSPGKPGLSERDRPAAGHAPEAGRAETPASATPVLLLAAALAVVVVIVFLPVRGFGFLPWDDPHYVYENPRVLAGLSLDNARWAFSFASPYWHPMTWMSLMLDVSLFGPSPGKMHVMALGMHAASAVLLFLFLARTTRLVWPSVFVAAIFALHPTRVESVAWIAERKDVLPGLCMMVVLHAYVWYVRRPSWQRYLLVALPLAIGLMAKPILITLPFTLMLLDVWPLNRISLAGEGTVRDRLRHFGRRIAPLVVEKLPWIALSLGAIAANFALQAQPIATLESVPPALRLANAVTYYPQYVGTFLWPAGLSPLHPLPRTFPPVWMLLGSLILIGAVSAFVLRQANRRPYLAVGWAVFLGTLVPVIGLVQAGDQGRADRFGYIAYVGLAIMVAWGAVDVTRRRPGVRRATAALGLLAVAACAWGARAYLPHWRDGIALWSRAVAVDPTNHRAHANLGNALASVKRLDEAEAAFRVAIRQAPEVPEYRRFLGVALARHGRVDAAIAELEALVRDRPADAKTLDELGSALSRAGRFADATARHQAALAIDSASAVTYANLCVALMGAGRLDEARAACLEAVVRRPELAQAHSNLGAIALAQGRADDAILAFREASRLDPWSAERRANLGAALARLQRFDEAAATLREAVALDPGYAEAHSALGAVLSEQGLTGDAIDAFTRAIALRPDSPHVYGNRGRARALQGDVAGAIQDYERMLQLDPSSAAARAALDVLKRSRGGG